MSGGGEDNNPNMFRDITFWKSTDPTYLASVKAIVDALPIGRSFLLYNVNGEAARKLYTHAGLDHALRWEVGNTFAVPTSDDITDNFFAYAIRRNAHDLIIDSEMARVSHLQSCMSHHSLPLLLHALLTPCLLALDYAGWHGFCLLRRG
jgi:hypothetical protein